MKRKFVVIMIVLSMVLSSVSMSFASSDMPDWEKTKTIKSSMVEEIGDVVNVFSWICGLVKAPEKVANKTSMATFINWINAKIAKEVEFVNIYYKYEIFTSPDGYAYYWKKTFYSDSDYTINKGYVYSDIFYITCSQQPE